MSDSSPIRIESQPSLAGSLYFKRETASCFSCSPGIAMSDATRAAEIENVVDELIALYLAQAADLREFAKAAAAGEGIVHLERTLRHREALRTDLYRRFERAAYLVPQGAGPDCQP
jgi:hypothetical protein